jgi:hypothetical protein
MLRWCNLKLEFLLMTVAKHALVTDIGVAAVTSVAWWQKRVYDAVSATFVLQRLLLYFYQLFDFVIRHDDLVEVFTKSSQFALRLR